MEELLKTLQKRDLTPLEEAQLNASGFVANVAMWSMIQDLITRSKELEAARASLEWKENIDDRKRLLASVKESKEISNALLVIAQLNAMHYGIEA
jgi:hypothetical protein